MEQVNGGSGWDCAGGIALFEIATGLLTATTGPIGFWAMVSYVGSGLTSSKSCADWIMEMEL